MKASSTLYWLYAVLNKNFGKTVRMNRGSLCKRYAVNRYDTEVYASGVDIKIVILNFTRILSESGYVDCDGMMLKRRDKDDTYISIRNYKNCMSLSIFRYNR